MRLNAWISYKSTHIEVFVHDVNELIECVEFMQVQPIVDCLCDGMAMVR